MIRIYDEKDLKDFGDYLLSDERRDRITRLADFAGRDSLKEDYTVVTATDLVCFRKDRDERNILMGRE